MHKEKSREMGEVDIFNTTKKHDVIYADPPWSYQQHGNGKGTTKGKYETMSTKEICDLPIKEISSKRAVLFMWATFPNIREALKVIEKWGFIYKTAAFLWVKKNKKTDSYFWGMGAYTRANAEVCLLAISKNTRAQDIVERHDIHQIIDAPIEKHSKKPDIVRKKIKALVGKELQCIELFARQQSKGWDCWGNEVGKLDDGQMKLFEEEQDGKEEKGG